MYSTRSSKRCRQAFFGFLHTHVNTNDKPPSEALNTALTSPRAPYNVLRVVSKRTIAICSYSTSRSRSHVALLMSPYVMAKDFLYARHYLIQDLALQFCSFCQGQLTSSRVTAKSLTDVSDIVCVKHKANELD